MEENENVEKIEYSDKGALPPHRYWTILERLGNKKVRARCEKCKTEYVRNEHQILYRSTQCQDCSRREQKKLKSFIIGN